MYAYMVAYGTLQCDEVVEGSLWGEALTIPELKVVYIKDPIILVDTDVMKAKPSEKLGGWGFHYVGLDPRSRA